MKKHSLFSVMVMTAASLAVGFTSCSQEDVAPASNDGRITFTSYVPVSRAGQDVQSTQIAQGVQVGVFVTNEDGSYINNGNNNLITANGAGGFTTTTQMYWPSAGKANIYAYAPYNSAWTSQGVQDFAVSLDQTTDAAYLKSDLLFGTPASNPVTATETSVPLVFGHKLSKVNITLVSNDEAVSFNNSTVTIVGVANKTAINLTTGEVSADDAEGSADVKVASFGENESAYKCAAIIVPQQVKAGSFLLISTEDKAYSCSLASDMEFKSGLVYNFTVTVNGTQADLDLDSTITDWTEGGSSDLDPEEVVPPVVYEVGDYLLEDGTMVKKSAYTSGTVVGVVFSTEVSTTDAEAGYKGYILGIKNALGGGTSKFGGFDKDQLWKDGQTDQLKDVASSLDGLSNTEYYTKLISEKYDSSDEKVSSSVFAKASALTKVDNENISSWFVPSIGQMLQIINNLGSANVSFSDSESNYRAFFAPSVDGVSIDGVSTFTGIAKTTLVANVKSAAANFEFWPTAAYLTSSCRGYNLTSAWILDFRTDKITSSLPSGYDSDYWMFQSNAGLDSSGYRAVFCVAYK